MKILFYDTKPYDRESFEALLPQYPSLQIDFLTADITRQTASLASGYDAICVFVASDLSKEIIRAIADAGIKLILLRCAGYNNVDHSACADENITVVNCKMKLNI